MHPYNNNKCEYKTCIYYCCKLDGIPSVDSEPLKNSKCLSVLHVSIQYSLVQVYNVESSTREEFLILMSKITSINHKYG